MVGLNNENWTMFVVLGILCLGFIVLTAIGLVSGHLASLLGFSGWMWWCVTILFFIVICGIIGAVNRIGV